MKYHHLQLLLKYSLNNYLKKLNYSFRNVYFSIIEIIGLRY
jgi:hypothetical protein